MSQEELAREGIFISYEHYADLCRPPKQPTTVTDAKSFDLSVDKIAYFGKSPAVRVVVFCGERLTTFHPQRHTNTNHLRFALSVGELLLSIGVVSNRIDPAALLNG